MAEKIVLVPGSACTKIAEQVARKLGAGARLARVERKHFSDGENYARVLDPVKGKTVFVVQSTSQPNDNFVELLLLLNACKTEGARAVYAIVPYFGYGRADKQFEPGEPVSARVMQDAILAAGAQKIFSIDVHAPHAVPRVTSIPATKLFAETLARKFAREDVVLVSPDKGGVERVRALASEAGRWGKSVTWVFAEKHRPQPNVVSHIKVHGRVAGKAAVIYDDIIDTGGTLVKLAEELERAGAESVYAFCTHAVFSGNAVEKIRDSPIAKLVVTNSVPVARGSHKILVVSAASLIAEAVKRFV